MPTMRPTSVMSPKDGGQISRRGGIGARSSLFGKGPGRQGGFPTLEEVGPLLEPRGHDTVLGGWLVLACRLTVLASSRLTRERHSNPGDRDETTKPSRKSTKVTTDARAHRSEPLRPGPARSQRAGDRVGISAWSPLPPRAPCPDPSRFAWRSHLLNSQNPFLPRFDPLPAS